MLRLLLALLPLLQLGSAATCSSLDNNPETGLNYFDCTNAGSCSGTSGRAKCRCCDVRDNKSWCYNGMNNGQPFPVQYALSGDNCDELNVYQVMTWGWRFETEDGQTDPVSCDDVTTKIDCSEVYQNCTASPNLSPSLMMALRYPCNSDCSAVDTTFSGQDLYQGLVLSVGCHTCTPENPCQRQKNSPPSTKGTILAFASFYNTHYNPACTPPAPNDPGECAENDDYGHQANYAYKNSRGDDKSSDMTLTRTLIAVLEGTHPLCGTPTDFAFPGGACKQALGFSLSPEKGMPKVYNDNLILNNLKNFKLLQTKAPTADPTPVPTGVPTPTPTVPDDICFKYTNEIMDHRFVGSGANCRAGLDPNPDHGEKTCESPYVVCLPDEHTPKNPDPTADPNRGKAPGDTEYTILECAAECAFDQRCTGFELQPDTGSNKGRCLLIDDYPIVVDAKDTWPLMGSQIGPQQQTVLSPAHIAAGLPILKDAPDGLCCDPATALENKAGAFEDDCQEAAFINRKANYYSYAAAIKQCTICEDCPGAVPRLESLYKSKRIKGRLELGGALQFNAASDALCFEKQDYCNPYFEAADLDEEMLKCYCPNNRKGTYTKKVKRTVANSKFCTEGYPEIDLRIKKAQANRMFHLCENWCLFETHQPKTESWYWNPWKKCWREQYAGVGMHRSYCNRVIRDPNTIEQKFIDKRSKMFCRKDPITNDVLEEITPIPTESPVVFPSTWYMADEEDTCDDACNKRGMQCDELTTNSILTGMDTEMSDALAEASNSRLVCNEVMTAKDGWAAPGIKLMGRVCLLRSPNTHYTGCNWALGVGYKRICACYNTDG